MRIYLAGTSAQWKAYFTPEDFCGAYLLESFFYCDAYTEKQVIPNCGDFLLDSGAYTFMQGKSTVPDFDEYAERYAAFINRNGIEKYFECSPTDTTLRSYHSIRGPALCVRHGRA